MVYFDISVLFTEKRSEVDILPVGCFCESTWLERIYTVSFIADNGTQTWKRLMFPAGDQQAQLDLHFLSNYLPSFLCSKAGRNFQQDLLDETHQTAIFLSWEDNRKTEVLEVFHWCHFRQIVANQIIQQKGNWPQREMTSIWLTKII